MFKKDKLGWFVTWLNWMSMNIQWSCMAYHHNETMNEFYWTMSYFIIHTIIVCGMLWFLTNKKG